MNSEKLFRQSRFDLIPILSDLPLSRKLVGTFKDLQSFCRCEGSSKKIYMYLQN